MLAESQYITRENLEFIAQDIGHLLMPLITDAETVMKSPAVQALLAEECRKYRNEMRRAKRHQQKALQKELLLEKQRQQELLLEKQTLVQREKQRLQRYLTQRFGTLSETVRQQITTMTDLEQLEIWLDQSLTVSTLAEFEQFVHQTVRP